MGRKKGVPTKRERAKQMSFEDIYSKIATLKSKIRTIDSEIEKLENQKNQARSEMAKLRNIGIEKQRLVAQ